MFGDGGAMLSFRAALLMARVMVFSSGSAPVKPSIRQKSLGSSESVSAIVEIATQKGSSAFSNPSTAPAGDRISIRHRNVGWVIGPGYTTSTKLAMTFLSPAFSKAISSLPPSTALILP